MGFFDTLGPVVLKIILQVGFGILAVVILTALYFATRFYVTWRRKQKNFKITALIHNPDGSWYTQLIGKFKGPDNVDKMMFIGSTDTCPVIDLRYIRYNKVELWRYGPGQYAVIPPTMWQKMRPEDFKIDVINLQMKNFAFLEQRAAVSRWAYTKDIIQRYAPYITVLMILIFAGVAIYLVTKMTLGEFGDVITARTKDCASILGGGSTVPPG